MRYLAIDHGRKRIGLAIGDSQARLASPLRQISATGRLAEDVASVLAAAEEYAADEFVVGLPLNMDSSEGEQAKVSRRFGDELARRSGKPVHYFDERLSTFAAEQLLAGTDFTFRQKNARADSLAAQAILDGFLQSPPGTPRAGDPEQARS